MLKKIRPLYLYLGGIIIGIIALFIYANIRDNKNPEMNTPPVDITDKPMPNDQIHKGLENPVAQKPSKSNVKPTIMQHMEELKEAITEHPRDTLKLREYADFLTDAQMNDKAVEYYQKILKINPRRVDIMSSLVYIYFAENNLNEAEKYLNKILSIDKKNEDAMYNLGAVSANKGNKEKAKELWTKLIKEFPNSQLAEKAKESLAQL